TFGIGAPAKRAAFANFLKMIGAWSGLPAQEQEQTNEKMKRRARETRCVTHRRCILTRTDNTQVFSTSRRRKYEITTRQFSFCMTSFLCHLQFSFQFGTPIEMKLGEPCPGS